MFEIENLNTEKYQQKKEIYIVYDTDLSVHGFHNTKIESRLDIVNILCVWVLNL